ECRRLYLEYVDVHARLLNHPGLGLPAPRPVVPLTRQRQALRYVAVAAGTLAASLLPPVFLWPRGREADRAAAPVAVAPRLPEYVATVTQAAGCVWEGTDEELRIGSRLLPGELRLRQGVARLR